MRKPLKGILFLALLVALTQQVNASNEKLRLVDFEDPNVTRNMAVWEHNILDPDQSLKMAIVEDDGSQGKGQKMLRLDFDVDSSRPAMAGLRVNLENQDFRGYDTLHINMRSDSEKSFTGNLALQLTDDRNRKAPYLISGVKENWKDFYVPLKKFRRIGDWSKISEFEIIIDDINARPKEGTLFVDEISVLSSSGEIN